MNRCRSIHTTAKHVAVAWACVAKRWRWM